MMIDALWSREIAASRHGAAKVGAVPLSFALGGGQKDSAPSLACSAVEEVSEE